MTDSTRTPRSATRRAPTGAALPRADVTAAISEAMFTELQERGAARLSMEAVARRAGVGKAALYRRWSTKNDMLVDLVGTLTRQHIPNPADTGSLEGDVRAFLQATLLQARDPVVNQIALDLIAEANHSDSLATALREAVSQPRRDAAQSILGRAIDRGDLSATTDQELAIDLMISPLVIRLVLSGKKIDKRYLDRLTRAITAGISTSQR